MDKTQHDPSDADISARLIRLHLLNISAGVDLQSHRINISASVKLSRTFRSGLQSVVGQMQSDRCFKRNQPEMLVIKVLISILMSCKTSVGNSTDLSPAIIVQSRYFLYSYFQKYHEALLFLIISSFFFFSARLNTDTGQHANAAVLGLLFAK